MPALRTRLSWILLACAVLACPRLAVAGIQLLPSGSQWIQVGCYDIKAADLDGDGRPEAVAGVADQSKIAVVKNDGSGNLVSVTMYAVGVVQAVALQDFTGDGKIDVATADWNEGTMSLHVNLGGGSLGPRLAWAMGTHPRDIVGADLDADGILDAVVATAAGQVAIRRGFGGGTFGPLQILNLGGVFKGIDAGDIDHDGKIDLVLVDYSSQQLLVPLRNLGGFVFTQGPTVGLPVGPSDIKLVDLDGDGWLDAAVANEDGTASVSRNVGGTFQAPSSIPVGHLSQSIAVADFDLDGRPDLLVSNWSENSVTILRNLGGFSFLNAASASAGGGPRAAAAGDFDGDGRPDIVTGDFLGGTVHLLRNLSAQPLAHLTTLGLDFGTSYLGNAATLDATVRNDGNANLFVTPAALSGGQFSLVSPTGMFAVAPGVSANVRIAYARSVVGTAQDTLHLATNDSLALTLAIPLQGTTTPALPHVDLRTAALDFGTEYTGIPDTLGIVIANVGPAPLSVTPASLANPEFTVVSPAGAFNVTKGASVTLRVRYGRNADGAAEDILHFATNDPSAPEITVPLSGFAGPPPAALLSGPPPQVVAAGSQATAPIRIRNTGLSPLHVTMTNEEIDLAETSALDLGPTTAAFLRADPSGALWDLAYDGSVTAGSADSYMGGMKLAGFPVQSGGVLGLGGRELRLGPVSAGGLELTRKVYVSPGLGFVRFVDVAENHGAVPRTWTHDLTDNLGYAQIVPLLTSSGDATFTVADDWIVVPPDDAAGRRAVGRVLRTANAVGHPSLAWYRQTTFPNTYTRTTYAQAIPPHGRAVIVQWAIQGTDSTEAAAKAIALAQSPPEAYEHMDAIDRTTARNADPVPAVFAVVPQTLTIAGGDSLDVGVVFHGELASHGSSIQGTLRLLTDDPAQPEVHVPVALSVTGGTVVGVPPPPAREPATLALAGFLPNPLRGTNGARIAYRLATGERATITLYDVRGRLLARHALEHAAPGPGSITLGDALAPGVVWLRLEQGGKFATTKGVVLP